MAKDDQRHYRPDHISMDLARLDFGKRDRNQQRFGQGEDEALPENGLLEWKCLTYQETGGENPK